MFGGRKQWWGGSSTLSPTSSLDVSGGGGGSGQSSFRRNASFVIGGSKSKHKNKGSSTMPALRVGQKGLGMKVQSFKVWYLYPYSINFPNI